METTKKIIAETVTSDKGNLVWKVMIEGSRSDKKRGYCKTALAAIRFMYLLRKKNEGTEISPEHIEVLIQAHNEWKAAHAPKETEATVANA